MDTDNLPNSLAHTVVQGGPVGPQGIEPLALLVHDHADPVGQHAVIQKLLGPAGPKVKEPLLVLNHADPAGLHAATRLPAQPEPPRGGGLVERISDEEPTVRQVLGSALDSQLMEGITYAEVSLDSRPMEGSSCLIPVEQSILRSPQITRPRDGSDLVEKISDEDSRPMEGSSCLEPVKQSILRSSQTERPRIGDRLVEGISDKEPTVCQVPGSALDSQLIWRGLLSRSIRLWGEVSLDCRPMEGLSCLEPVEQAILLSSWTVSPRNCVIEQKSEWEPVITWTVDLWRG